MAKNEIQASANNISLIGTGTEINGEVKCAGDLRIDGTVVGNLQVQGKLVIGDKGLVDGEIVCSRADISGTLKGRIQVKEELILKSTSRLTGDIITKRLCIESGSIFCGNCTMGEAASNMDSGAGQ